MLSSPSFYPTLAGKQARPRNTRRQSKTWTKCYGIGNKQELGVTIHFECTLNVFFKECAAPIILTPAVSLDVRKKCEKLLAFILSLGFLDESCVMYYTTARTHGHFPEFCPSSQLVVFLSLFFKGDPGIRMLIFGLSVTEVAASS